MEKAAIPKKQNLVIRFGGFVFLPQKRMLCFGRQSVVLTKTEKELLVLFCNSANQLLPRDYALTRIWQYATSFNARSMDVYVSRLRKYLKSDPEVSIINVYGKGFKMLVPQIEITGGLVKG